MNVDDEKRAHVCEDVSVNANEPVDCKPASTSTSNAQTSKVI